MKKSIASMVFSIATVISAQVVGGDREDYAGLSLDEDETMPAAVEVIVHEAYAGYDGLPITRVIQPTFASVELEGDEAYDGVTRTQSLGYETWAFEE